MRKIDKQEVIHNILSGTTKLKSRPITNKQTNNKRRRQRHTTRKRGWHVEVKNKYEKNINKDFVAAVAIRPFPREEKRERTPGAAARRVTRGLRRLAFRTGVRGTRQLSTGSSDTRTVTQHKNQNKKKTKHERSFIRKKGPPFNQFPRTRKQTNNKSVLR